MLTLLDRAYVITRLLKIHKGSPRIFNEIGDDCEKAVLAFLPSLPSILMPGRFLGNQILRSVRNKGLSFIACEIPRYAVQDNPKSTKKVLDDAYNFMSGMIDKYNLGAKDIIVLGESIGCCHASRLAAEMGNEKLLLVVPGSRLSECIFESYATRRAVEKAKANGYNLEDYSKELSEYNPISYVPSIKGRVDIYLASHDLMIPTKRGMELAEAYRAEEKIRGNLKVNVEMYKFFDHSSAGIRFATRFSHVLDNLLEEDKK